MRELLISGLTAVAHNVDACAEGGLGAGRAFLEVWSDGHSSEMAKTLGHFATIHPRFHDCGPN